jgi:hypothetical protein
MSLILFFFFKIRKVGYKYRTAFQWLGLLFHMWVALGSSLGQVAGYHDRNTCGLISSWIWIMEVAKAAYCCYSVQKCLQYVCCSYFCIWFVLLHFHIGMMYPNKALRIRFSGLFKANISNSDWILLVISILLLTVGGCAELNSYVFCVS